MLSASKSGSASGASGYNLTRSLRFRASASAYLNRTPSVAGSLTTWTWSSWVKRGSLAAYSTLLNGYSSGANQTGILFWVDDTLVFTYTVASIEYRLTTTQVFRDPSAYYHIIYAVDTTQATAANRVKLYVNGTQVTAFSGSYPPQNSDLFVNSTNVHNMGRNAGGGNNFDGYLAENNLVDGQQLTPSSFGSTNALTGVWQPARYTGTYGTNGFYLPFTDNSALTTSSNVGLGKDFSGNGNYWTTNNISLTAGVTYDSMTDVPTLTSATAANFAVLNPLNPSRSTLTNGNLTASGATDTPTIIPTSGTYYFEIDGVSTSWTPPAAFPAAAGNYNFGQRPFTNTPTGTLLNTYNLPTSTIVKGNTVMDATLYTGNGGTITVANAASFKPDLVWTKSRSTSSSNHLLTDSVRGNGLSLTSNNTGAELTRGSTITSTGFSYTYPNEGGDGNFSGVSYVAWQWQAGQGSSSSNTNGTITSTVSVNASAGFGVVTYTGNGTAGATVGHGLGVAPAFIINKSRSAVISWAVYHSALTGTAGIFLDQTTLAVTNSGYWNNTNPTSSVFSIGNSTLVNVSSQTQVAYCWAEIAGFSKFGIYTGNGSTDGVFVFTPFRPKFVIIKRTDTTGDWYTFDTSRDPYNATAQGLSSNSSAVEASYTGWGDLLSNGFKIRRTDGAWNASGGTYIYMAFAENPLKNALAR